MLKRYKQDKQTCYTGVMQRYHADVKMDSLLKTLGDQSIAMILDCKHMDVEKTLRRIYTVHIFCKVQSAGQRDIKNEEGNSKNGYHNVKCQVPETEDLEAAERKKRWKAQRERNIYLLYI